MIQRKAANKLISWKYLRNREAWGWEDKQIEQKWSLYLECSESLMIVTWNSLESIDKLTTVFWELYCQKNFSTKLKDMVIKVVLKCLLGSKEHTFSGVCFGYGQGG